PDATAETIDEEGWLHSGDMASVDEDGYFFIVDRKKDMIIRGGFNVYPRELEEVLYEHPAVAEAAVIRIAHEALGEAVALEPARGGPPGPRGSGRAAGGHGGGGRGSALRPHPARCGRAGDRRGRRVAGARTRAPAARSAGRPRTRGGRRDLRGARAVREPGRDQALRAARRRDGAPRRHRARADDPARRSTGRDATAPTAPARRGRRLGAAGA